MPTSALRTVLVTGGAGFIGSAVCRHLVAAGGWRVVNVDALTYAGNLDSLASVAGSDRYVFHRADIGDGEAMAAILAAEGVEAVMHLAAETHVDRSIDGPMAFVRTNVTGVATLLAAVQAHWQALPAETRDGFRFHHVSTDEVFGDLGPGDPPFSESSAYAPSSPYSASKAASDHFVRAWQRTYGLPVVLSSCSNNYGPYQFPEKLIPLAILNALEGREIPVYGTGANIRDWLFVDDHVRALEAVLTQGEVSRTYCIGARSERTNLQVVEAICEALDRRAPRPDGSSHRSLIRFVGDRPGHDQRYAIDPGRIETELGWRPELDFEAGLERTIAWYLANAAWWSPLRERVYAGGRLGGGRRPQSGCCWA